MIIDIHAHPAPNRGDSLEAIQSECRKNGVGRVLISSIGRWSQYPPPDEVRAANDEARSLAERSGGLASWLAYINPQNADWREELDRALAGGPVGLKLLISLKDPSGSLDNTLAVIRCAAEKKLPILIHTFQKATNSPGEITLEEFASLADRCPAAKLIAAHAGGHWRHSLGILRHRAPNAAVDISGSFPQKGMVEALVKDMGANRILFGSDILGRSQASQIAKVIFEDIPDPTKGQILYGNALAIFGPAIAPRKPRPAPPLRPASQLPDFRDEHFCFCGQWAFFATECKTPLELDRLLAAERIDRAYTANLGSIYRLELERANATFLRGARRALRVAALATLNPRAHNWRQVIEALELPMSGAIVYPYLHDWQLDDDAHAEFFRRCAERRIRLWINCRLGDDRFRHCGLACRAVSPEELIRFGKSAPENAYVFQGLTADEICGLLGETPSEKRFRFEISRLTDHPGGLDRVAAKHGISCLVMGSEFPFRDIRTVRCVGSTNSGLHFSENSGPLGGGISGKVSPRLRAAIGRPRPRNQEDDQNGGPTQCPSASQGRPPGRRGGSAGGRESALGEADREGAARRCTLARPLAALARRGPPEHGGGLSPGPRRAARDRPVARDGGAAPPGARARLSGREVGALRSRQGAPAPRGPAARRALRGRGRRVLAA